MRDDLSRDTPRDASSVKNHGRQKIPRKHVSLRSTNIIVTDVQYVDCVRGKSYTRALL